MHSFPPHHSYVSEKNRLKVTLKRADCVGRSAKIHRSVQSDDWWSFAFVHAAALAIGQRFHRRRSRYDHISTESSTSQTITTYMWFIRDMNCGISQYKTWTGSYLSSTLIYDCAVLLENKSVFRRWLDHFWATVCKTVRPMLSAAVCPVLSVTLVYCGQMVGWIKMKLGRR